MLLDLRAERRPGLLGRSDTLALLEIYIEKAVKQLHIAIPIVTGPQGMGRSAVVHELIERSKNTGRAAGYGCVRSGLGQALIDATLSLAACIAGLNPGLDVVDDLTDAAAAFRDRSPDEATEAGFVVAIDHLLYALSTALTDVPRGYVLCIDDLQVANDGRVSAFLEGLIALSSTGAPIPVVLTSSVGIGVRSIPLGLDQLSLRPLTNADLADIAQRKGVVVTPEVIRSIGDYVEGRPGRAIEIIDRAVAKGLVDAHTVRAVIAEARALAEERSAQQNVERLAAQARTAAPVAVRTEPVGLAEPALPTEEAQLVDPADAREIFESIAALTVADPRPAPTEQVFVTPSFAADVLDDAEPDNTTDSIDGASSDGASIDGASIESDAICVADVGVDDVELNDNVVVSDVVVSDVVVTEAGLPNTTAEGAAWDQAQPSAVHDAVPEPVRDAGLEDLAAEFGFDPTTLRAEDIWRDDVSEESPVDGAVVDGAVVDGAVGNSDAAAFGPSGPEEPAGQSASAEGALLHAALVEVEADVASSSPLEPAALAERIERSESMLRPQVADAPARELLAPTLRAELPALPQRGGLGREKVSVSRPGTTVESAGARIVLTPTERRVLDRLAEEESVVGSEGPVSVSYVKRALGEVSRFRGALSPVADAVATLVRSGLLVQDLRGVSLTDEGRRRAHSVD